MNLGFVVKERRGKNSLRFLLWGATCQIAGSPVRELNITSRRTFVECSIEKNVMPIQNTCFTTRLLHLRAKMSKREDGKIRMVAELQVFFFSTFF